MSDARKWKHIAEVFYIGLEVSGCSLLAWSLFYSYFWQINLSLGHSKIPLMLKCFIICTNKTTKELIMWLEPCTNVSTLPTSFTASYFSFIFLQNSFYSTANCKQCFVVFFIHLYHMFICFICWMFISIYSYI